MLKRHFAPACTTLLLFLVGSIVPAHAATSGIDHTSKEVLQELRKDLAKKRHTDFREVLGRWEKAYGTRAVHPLIQIASDRAVDDADRYLALMGAARLGGTEVASRLVPLLKDRSWMIRAGTLHALGALAHPKTGASVLPLLRDPALLVRVEAVEAAMRLKPKGTIEALTAALVAPENYHRGKAQWIPGKALSGLVELKAKSAVPHLRPLLLRSSDPALQEKTVQALEALTGLKLGPKGSLSERVALWKHKLKK